jgi:RimJ/RimL family protein N-acetyltransferase
MHAMRSDAEVVRYLYEEPLSEEEVDWVFTSAGFHRVIGRTEARNTASVRVLEKLGMRLEAHFVENEWVKASGRANSSTRSSTANGGP